jgi:DivIVA domain-containing protein
VDTDAIRQTTFRHDENGYDARDVDAYLGRLADELDGGSGLGETDGEVRFRRARYLRTGYETCAVDLFLGRFIDGPTGRLRLPQTQYSAGIGSAPPWPDDPVSNWYRRQDSGREQFKSRSEECREAYSRFSELSGTRIRMERSRLDRRLLVGDAGQLLAAMGMSSQTVVVGEHTYVQRRGGIDVDAGLIIHDAVSARFAQKPLNPRPKRHEWVDKQSGEVVLWQAGNNLYHHAAALIVFPNGDWWRFPVRGTYEKNAIMTALNSSGSSVARYRLRYPSRRWYRRTIDIVVHPGLRLNDEQVLAFALSAPWLRDYFKTPPSVTG